MVCGALCDWREKGKNVFAVISGAGESVMRFARAVDWISADCAYFCIGLFKLDVVNEEVY